MSRPYIIIRLIILTSPKQSNHKAFFTKNGIHSTRLASLERGLKRNGVMAKREKGYMMEAEAAAEKGGNV
jgi:hypothetical protein